MNKITNYALLADDISNWLKNYLETNKLSCFILGTSGGIDSAVIGALCARTGIETCTWTIPINSLEKNNELAFKQLQWLYSTYIGNVSIGITSLDSTYNEFIKVTELSELAKANTKSRLRMTYLYAMANTRNGLVVGSGCLPEDFGVFFFTRGGDGVTDINPIAQLKKSEVWGLGRYLGVPQEIIDAEPTDGLWEDGRIDSTQIKLSYPEIEFAMDYINEGLTHALTKHQEEIIERYKELHNKGKFKMEPIPTFKVDREKYKTHADYHIA